ncbi:MAG TPA: CNNM domain-containing protein, partial [Aggregatilineales bacterium]|nr:CNNM domain-containing protein [Aggregatilineales bacterium]
AAIFGTKWAGVITIVLTILLLVFSEIIPKTIGAIYWKQLLSFTAYSLRVLIIILYPAVKALQILSRLLTPDEREPTITRSELEVLAEIGQEEGSIEVQEQHILQNLLRLGLVQVSDIMTPRTVVFMLREDMTVDEVLRKHPVLAHARIPIYNRNHDDITGFVLRYQVLAEAAEDNDQKKLKELVVPIHSIPESLNAFKALQEFITRGEHIFLALDEYGGTAGIITMEDAIESLLGTEIVDESDVVEDMQLLAKQRYARQQRLYAAREAARQKIVSDKSDSSDTTGQNTMTSSSEA